MKRIICLFLICCIVALMVLPSYAAGEAVIFGDSAIAGAIAATAEALGYKFWGNAQPDEFEEQILHLVEEQQENDPDADWKDKVSRGFVFDGKKMIAVSAWMLQFVKDLFTLPSHDWGSDNVLEVSPATPASIGVLSTTNTSGLSATDFSMGVNLWDILSSMSVGESFTVGGVTLKVTSSRSVNYTNKNYVVRATLSYGNTSITGLAFTWHYNNFSQGIATYARMPNGNIGLIMEESSPSYYVRSSIPVQYFTGVSSEPTPGISVSNKYQDDTPITNTTSGKKAFIELAQPIEVPDLDSEEVAERILQLVPEENPDDDKYPYPMEPIVRYIGSSYSTPQITPDPVPQPTPDPAVPLPDGSQDLAPVPDNISDLTVPYSLRDVFPFCIPFDIYNFFSALVANREAPHFQWELNVPKVVDYTFDIDLSEFETAAAILRTMELLAFCVGLALITRQLIKW